MFGAILGDIIGSPYELDRGDKTKDFPLFSEASRFTDDTVMTIAVADGLKKASGESLNDENVRKCIEEAMILWGNKYPDAGYGGNFKQWLMSEEHSPYGSYGNGSAMRVSAAGWVANSVETARRLARASAEITHNHPEGIKGAEAVASAVFIARANGSKEDIRNYITSEFGYDLSKTCDEIRPDYHHDSSCQGSVPQAITAFLEGEDFVDVVRTAVSLGGDCDTQAAIAGSIAEAYYGVPVELKCQCYERLDEELGTILSEFEMSFQFNEMTAWKYHPVYWFSKDEEGFVQMERPYARAKKMTRAMDAFDTSSQALDGWRRACLYMGPFRVWDGAAFGTWMDSTYAYTWMSSERASAGERYTLTFTTPQAADKTVYPYLPEDVVKQCRANVEAFYEDKMLQLEWSEFILHPVALKITRKGEAIPVAISEIRKDEIDFQNQETFDFAKLKDMKSNIITFYHEDKDYGCFSNWYAAEFQYAGRVYSSVEQYMMYQKAAMFEEFQLAESIMASDDPAEIKKLGRSHMAHFDARVWDKTSYTIVKRGVYAKFYQNPQLAEILLDTGNKILAEASLHDRKWGIGVDSSDEARFSVSSWKGENLLGRALMEVRESLRRAEPQSAAESEHWGKVAEDFSEWHMKAGELKCNPAFYNAIHAYADTLDSRRLRNRFYYECSLYEWEQIIKEESLLPRAGFWEMKQEIGEIIEGKK